MLLIANVFMPSFTPTLRGAVEAVKTNLSGSVGQNLDMPLKVMMFVFGLQGFTYLFL